MAGLIVVFVSVALVFVKFKVPDVPMPVIGLLGEQSVRTVGGFMIFSSITEFFGQIIRLRVDKNIYHPSIKDFRWLKFPMIWIMQLAIFGWFWPGTYGLWEEVLS